MSVAIETTEELLTLLRKLRITVGSVEELRGLLASINASYNPQAARVRTAKLVAISVPCTLGFIAGAVSTLLTIMAHGIPSQPYPLGAFAVVWGSCALVSVTALIFGFTLALGRQARTSPESAAQNKSSDIEERITNALRRDLSV